MFQVFHLFWEGSDGHGANVKGGEGLDATKALGNSRKLIFAQIEDLDRRVLDSWGEGLELVLREVEGEQGWTPVGSVWDLF